MLLECLKPSAPEHKLKGALYIVNTDRYTFYYDWSDVAILYPAIVRANHSDRLSIIDLLKEFSIRTNRIYTDCSLYTLPVRVPQPSRNLKTLFGIQTEGE